MKAGLVVLLFSLCFRADGAASPFSKGPYVQFPAPGTVTIIWESLTNHVGIIHFGTPGRLDREVGPVVAHQMTSGGSGSNVVRTFYLYQGKLEGLAPGATYSYSVRLDRARTPARNFRILAPEAERVRFVAYGDSRSDPVKHAALARRFLKYSPDFVLHTGDLVARGKEYDLWSREFFDPMARVIDHVPFFPVIGNHEQDGTNYLSYFDLPGNKLWYSVDAGPVHILALDFRCEKPAFAQLEFARKDLLTSRAAWKIVFLHVPVYNIGGHGSSWGHKDFLPLFHDANVDLVLTGHSHLYERFRPLAAHHGSGKQAITHVTTGGGGAGLSDSPGHPALVAHARTHHFVLFDADRDELTGKAIGADGRVLDRFRIRKTGGNVAPEYLVQGYSEESLDLFYEFATTLAAGVPALPLPGEAAEVMFTVPARTNSAAPAELEISLRSDSAQHYVLVGGPLRVTTPANGTKRVWARVLPMPGRSVTETKTREVVPALSFQAQVKTGAEETLAYGPKCRISKVAQEALKQREQ